ncbi:MAG: hypothetical protein Q9180_009388 [Flavoplaca navasiana]
MAERLLPKQTPKASHGRGGAGNIGPTVNDASKNGLTTPTIKTSIYTTGRGGSGNMKHNDPRHPELARKSQDVVPPVKRKHIEERSHTGRGKRFIHPYILRMYNLYNFGSDQEGGERTTHVLKGLYRRRGEHHPSIHRRSDVERRRKSGHRGGHAVRSGTEASGWAAGRLVEG